MPTPRSRRLKPRPGLVSFKQMQRICHRSRAKYLLFGQVEEAQMQRTNKQLILERFARIWTPAVLISVPRLSGSDGNDAFGVWF